MENLIDSKYLPAMSIQGIEGVGDRLFTIDDKTLLLSKRDPNSLEIINLGTKTEKSEEIMDLIQQV